MLGIPGTNDQGIGDQRYAGYPAFDDRLQRRSATATAGTRSSATSGPTRWRTNITKLKGRHDFRGGYFLNFLYLDHWQPETGNPRGQFDFHAQHDRRCAAARPPNFYNQYAAFLLGQVGTANKSVQNELMTAREWQHALFFRDRWTPNAKLTVDLGLRWEVYPIMHRADGRGIDRSISQPGLQRELDVLIAGRGDNPQTNGMEAGLDNFAPRLGAHLPHQRQDGVPHRLRPDLQRARRGRARCAATTTTR